MKYILLYCLLTAVLISPVTASDSLILDSYTHTVELKGTVSYHEIMIVVIGPGDELRLNLPPGIEKFSILIDEKETAYILSENNGSSLLRCSLPENPAARHFISITFQSSYPVFELQNRMLYRSEYVPENRIARFTYILKLPVGFMIPDEKDVSYFINPQPKSIYSDGHRIILLWERKDMSSTFDVSVLMEPAGISSTNISAVLLSALVFLILGSGLIYYLRTARKESFTYPALVEQEKVVVDLLRKAEKNVLWQKQVQVQSGFSKVKVSRLLQSLEKRGVIRKEPWGNTNKIHLIIEKESPEK